MNETGTPPPRAFSILRLLGHDAFRSGEEIARLLGMSRASVWQALRDMERHGIELHRLPGRGYRLAAPVEWLDAGEYVESDPICLRPPGRRRNGLSGS